MVEAIKLFESGLVDHCQATWVVISPPEVQLKRLVERRKMAPGQAKQRIRSQPPPEEKVAKADMVIDNSGDLGKTWLLVKKQYIALVQAQANVTQSAPAAEPVPAAPTPVPETAAPTAEVSTDNLSVRRAKRADLQAMAQLIATGTKGAVDPDVSQMMESLFSRAYLVAMAGEYVVGIAGWQTENLIAGLQDFFVLRDDLWSTVGQEMLDKIHEEIDSLSCEVALIFVSKQAGSKSIEFFESQGYQETESKELGYMWKDAALEWQSESTVLLYKKLREQRIMVPM